MIETPNTVTIPLGELRRELALTLKRGDLDRGAELAQEIREYKAAHYRKESRRVAQIPPYGRDDQGD